MRITLATVLLLVQASMTIATQWEEDGHVFGSWHLWFGTSELNDSPAVLAQVTDEISGYGLTVACEEHYPYVGFQFVNEGERISEDLIEVNLRLDKNDPEQMVWFPTASGKGAIIGDSAALSLIVAMNAVDELYIRASDNTIGNRGARFQMIGIREITYQIQKACPENN